MSNLTPMMKQYLETKEQYPGCILFFRLGDFYEVFFDDAETAARELEITLTGRGADRENRIPMAGIPHHAAEGYIARLLAKGYRVALCDQVEDPALAKGLVRREVTRVYTPGTVLESGMLDDKKNNFLLAAIEEHGTIGLAWADLSTGEFMVTALDGMYAESRLIDEVLRIQPTEILATSEFLHVHSRFKIQLDKVSRTVFTTIESLDENTDKEILLKDQFGSNATTEWLVGEPAATSACQTVLKYLRQTGTTVLDHFKDIRRLSVGERMVLDVSTRRNLELTASLRDGSRKGTLLGVLDRTVTAMGARLLKQWIECPLLDTVDIRNRLDSVEELLGDLLLREETRSLLKQVYDLERLSSRAVCGTANARDLVALRLSLSALPQFEQRLAEVRSIRLQSVRADLHPLDELTDLLERSLEDNPPIGLRDGNIIRAGYQEEVDKLRLASREGKGWIAQLEAAERERSGIRTLKVGFNRVFGYYIEVTQSQLAHVPDDYQRKQTLANAERYVTPQLKEYESLILGSEERLTSLEFALFCEVRDTVAKHSGAIQRIARALAEYDCLCSLAEIASLHGYCKPSIWEDDRLVIRDGRHPVVEQVLDTGSYVPNDCHLNNDDQRVWIITGPNMAGKSTFMRQVALITLIAQIGSYVPARSAEIGIVDRIFTRVGAADDLVLGQSTFMVEMSEVSNILRHATPRSLVILDEVGRGTSTFDGMSIARAVVEYIHDPELVGSKTLFATHYHELTDLADEFAGVQNYSIAVREQGADIIFLRKIIPGGADQSYGIQVARLAGLPPELLRRAREILVALEQGQYYSAREVSTAKGDVLPFYAQPIMFSEPPNPVLEALKSLFVDELTPLQALNFLSDLQKQVKSTL